MKCRYCGWEGDESRALNLHDSRGDICAYCREIRREYAKAALTGVLANTQFSYINEHGHLAQDCFATANAMMEQEMRE